MRSTTAGTHAWISPGNNIRVPTAWRRAFSDLDSPAHRDVHAGTDCDQDSRTHGYRHPDTGADGNAHALADFHATSHFDPHSYFDFYSSAYRDAGANSYCRACAGRYSDSNTWRCN